MVCRRAPSEHHVCCRARHAPIAQHYCLLARKAGNADQRVLGSPLQVHFVPLPVELQTPAATMVQSRLVQMHQNEVSTNSLHLHFALSVHCDGHRSPRTDILYTVPWHIGLVRVPTVAQLLEHGWSFGRNENLIFCLFESADQCVERAAFTAAGSPRETNSGDSILSSGFTLRRTPGYVCLLG